MVEYIVLVLGFILLFVPGGIFADIFLAFMWYVCTKNNQYRNVVEEKKRWEQLGFIEQAKSAEAWLVENKYKWWRFGAGKKEAAQKSIFTTKEDCVEVDCSSYGLNTTLIYPKPFSIQDYKEGERHLVENNEWLEGNCIYYKEEGSTIEHKFFCSTYDEANKLAAEMNDSYKFWGFGQIPTKVCIEREHVESHSIWEYHKNAYPDSYVRGKYSTKNGTEYGAYQLMTYAIQNKRSDSQMRVSDIVKKEPYLYYKHFIDKLMQKEHEQMEKVKQAEQVMA